ncbi:hypothetical protein Mucpa_5298 [Mucilaginibacter paludis DSM 18603]|uniref:Uncharacterized protein n=1 Tax=Mucilaginibacter paludis DSM 18603 TaxID=714943 RepID=H1Y7F2_9SPHI|nr:hypothetical protein Mucpa_5298 [Mucilaginibacter paludis DSM 18603]
MRGGTTKQSLCFTRASLQSSSAYVEIASYLAMTGGEDCFFLIDNDLKKTSLRGGTTKQSLYYTVRTCKAALPM